MACTVAQRIFGREFRCEILSPGDRPGCDASMLGCAALTPTYAPAKPQKRGGVGWGKPQAYPNTAVFPPRKATGETFAFLHSFRNGMHDCEEAASSANLAAKFFRRAIALL
jgi:hypothetical protein